MLPRNARIVGAAALFVLTTLLASPLAAADDAHGAALHAVRDHGVVVSITFQRDEDAEERGVTPTSSKGLAERYRFWRMSLVVPGFVVRDRRTVVIADPWISPTSVRQIRVRTADGFECDARLEAFLVEAEGAILRTAEDLPLEPVAFGGRHDFPAFAASIAEGERGFETWVEDLRRVRTRHFEPSGGMGWGRPESSFGSLDGDETDGGRSVDLVTDARGRPAGFRFGSRLAPGNRWRGARVLASPTVTFEALDQMEDAEAKASPLHHLRVTFRVLSRHDRDSAPWSMRRGTAEEEVWGLAIAPDLLVVPSDLEDEQVRRIVSIQLDDEAADDTVKATYLGRLQGYRAFLVKVEGRALTSLPPDQIPPPANGSALLVHRTAKRGGTRRDEVTYNRIVGSGRGYGDLSFLTTERRVPEGALLRAVDGRVLGFAARLDPEDKELSLDDGRRSRRNRSTYSVVAVLFHEVGAPASLGEHVDARVMPSEETEARRLPWLGVEYDPIDEGVAELLDISAPTRDGDRGLQVVVVYPGSPAEKHGLAAGDVLLAARRLSAPGGPPIDLSDEDGPDVSYHNLFGRGAPAPWRSRENTLVRLLKDWGRGTDWELTWLRDGKERTTQLKVETAPPDNSSAPRKFDEATGVEVRDLTYEIRQVLRLGADAPGVVVARREPGSPAAQARIEPNEIVVELDGRPVPSAEAFGVMLEEARAAERRVVRLVVRRLGRTRLVDLRVSSSSDDAAAAETPAAEEGT